MYQPQLPDLPLRDRAEALVSLAAHEFTHLFGADGDARGEALCERVARETLACFQRRRADLETQILAASRVSQLIFS